VDPSFVFRPEAALLPLVTRVSNAIHLRLAKLLELEGADLTPEQAMTMLQIMSFNVDSVTKLADVMLKDRTTVTRFVEQLVVRGYVLREKSAQDQRATVLKLSSEGRELMFRVIPRLERDAASLFSGLPAGDVIATNRVLHSLLHRCNLPLEEQSEGN